MPARPNESTNQAKSKDSKKEAMSKESEQIKRNMPKKDCKGK